MKERKSVNSRVNTPWGMSDYCYHYAPGIICYNTPGHGGFHLSMTRRLEMPAGLREFVGYGGAGWYEEDCDWAVVALAFPTVFEPMDVWAAIRTVQMFSDGYGQTVKMWLLSDASAPVRAIAAKFHQDEAKKFTRGCEGTTPGFGWFVSATTVDGSERATFVFPNVPHLPSPFTRADVVTVGGYEQVQTEAVHLPDECPA